MVLKRNTQINLASIFGSVFLTIILVVAIAIPRPSDFQYQVFRIILALAAGGVAAMIPGILNIAIPNFLSAGGALAVFVTVYFYSPAQLAVKVAESTYHPPESIARQQIDDAQAVFDAAMRHGLAEKGVLEEIISAHRQLIKVKLASCGTLAERIAVLTDALKTLQELESSVSEAIDAAVLPYSAISQARQYRVETEVELAKLQSSPNS
jgi:hypothetical protein